MDEWRKWPKVCAGRTGSANTKRYQRIVTHVDGCALGRYEHNGQTLAETVASINEGFQVYSADVLPSWNPGDTGVAVVGVGIGAQGLDRIRQSYVVGKSGTPRFYGERW